MAEKSQRPVPKYMKFVLGGSAGYYYIYTCILFCTDLSLTLNSFFEFEDKLSRLHFSVRCSIEINRLFLLFQNDGHLCCSTLGFSKNTYADQRWVAYIIFSVQVEYSLKFIADFQAKFINFLLDIILFISKCEFFCRFVRWGRSSEGLQQHLPRYKVNSASRGRAEALHRVSLLTPLLFIALAALVEVLFRRYRIHSHHHYHFPLLIPFLHSLFRSTLEVALASSANRQTATAALAGCESAGSISTALNCRCTLSQIKTRSWYTCDLRMHLKHWFCQFLSHVRR